MPESSFFILFFFYVCFPQRYSRLWRKCAEQILMLYGCLSEEERLRSLGETIWLISPSPNHARPPCHSKTMTAAKRTCSECDKYDVSYLGICWLRVCDQILIHKCDRWWWIANLPPNPSNCHKVCFLLGSPSYVMAFLNCEIPRLKFYSTLSPLFLEKVIYTNFE